jgi:hypothetical protein
MNKRLLIISAVILLGSALVSKKTSAAPEQSPKGITLSPAVVQTQIKEDESEHQLTFRVTNNQSTAQTINISTADFNTLDESGGLVFVGTNPTKLQKKYGLATWITLPQTSVTLQPNQTSTINASILNQATLAPGGHYGALMLSLQEGDQTNQPGKNKVSVHPIATSLLFINKVGGDIHRLQLADASTSHSIFHLPSSAVLRFHNSGNTHLIPRGVVNVTDPHGKLVSKGVINENSDIILPETYRRFTVPLKSIVTATVPGKYKISVDFRFDGYDQFRTYQTNQFLLPPILLLAIIAVIFATIVVVFMLKNRKIRARILGLKKTSKKSH